jgi:hypothetical protein
MSKIFISYARQDGSDVKRLVEAMNPAEVSGWLDETDLAAGQSVSAALREALKTSRGVVVALSPQAVNSSWVQFEMGAALAFGKIMVPVIVSGADVEGQLPDVLKDQRYIDARNKPAEQVVREIEQALQAA